MTDKTSVSAEIRTSDALVQLVCDDKRAGGFTLFIQSEQYLGAIPPKVYREARYRFDQDPAVVISVGYDRRLAIADVDSGFVNRARSAKQLLIRLTTYQNDPIDKLISLDGAAQVFPRLEATCKKL